MNKEKIITAESEHGETDLYDGMIMSAMEHISLLDNLDERFLKEIHSKVSHYINILQYLNDPVGHPKECLEACGVMKKFEDFNTGLLITIKLRIEGLLLLRGK